MAAKLFFKRALGTIRVLEKRTVDGVETVINKGVHVAHGDAIPDNVEPADLARLKELGAVGEKATVTVVDDEATATVEAAAQPVKAPAAPKATNRRTSTPGKATTPAADLSDLGSKSVDEIAQLITDGKERKVTGVSVKALLAAVGTDVDTAKKVLEAETQALKGDVRKELKTGLDKVIGGGS